MTDDRDRPLLGELEAWFAAEVRVAGRDLTGLRLPRVEPRTRLAPGSFAVGAIVATVVLIGGLFLSWPPGPGQPLPSAEESLMPTASPTAARVTEPPALGRARYTDGIPRTIGGEPVRRAAEAVGLAEAAVDDRPFLIGGWLWIDPVISCPMIPGDQPLLASRCPSARLDDTPLGKDGFVPVLDGTSVASGPVVLRVHARDRRATRCPVGDRRECATSLVVEEVVWSGDDRTTTKPLSVFHVLNRLRNEIPDLTLEPLDDRAMTDCDPGLPSQAWWASDHRLGYVLVFPSVEAREAAQGNFGASSLKGTTQDGDTCMVLFDAAFAWHWVAGANVMVEVQENHGGPTAEQRRLIDLVTDLLAGP